MNKRIYSLFMVLIMCIICINICGCGRKAQSNTTEAVFAEQTTTKKQETTSKEQVTTTKEQETTKEQVTTSKEPETHTEEESIRLKVEEKLSSMSLHEKVCQMFVITPESLTGYNKVTEAGEQTRINIEKYPIGGLVYFAYNLINPTQTMEMLNNVQRYSINTIGIPLFTCIDEEGGRVLRIGNNKAFGETKIGSMDKVSSKEEAYNIGSTIGLYLRKYGFNVDFAPVADVITNKKNNVIGDRSFGTDANIVATYASAVSDGLHSAGVLSTFKHFPGHGATEGDTHEGFAFTNKTYEEMKACEFLPFMMAKEKGVDMIMVAHISVPNIVGDNTPCSLSYKMITEILKGDLEYDGLVITDALNMGAIKNEYGSEEAVVMAVKAGNDILLMPEDFKSSVEAVKKAVENGEISEERINESVRKILMKKFSMK